MLDRDKIKGLTFQKRMVEGFKAVRKAGIKARLGPSWGVERQLRRELNWTYMPQWQYADMNNWGRNHGQLQCNSKETSEKVVEILSNYGIVCEVHRTNPHVINLNGTDDSLIGKTDLDAMLNELTLEKLLEQYCLD